MQCITHFWEYKGRGHQKFPWVPVLKTTPALDGPGRKESSFKAQFQDKI